MTPEVLPASFDPWLVALSFLISATGALTALAAAAHARGPDGRVRWFNAFLAGLALGGIGIWAMHFVGMVAWKVDLQVGYHLLPTLVSGAAAVVVATLALGYVANGPVTPRRLLVAGPLAGLGVAVMHYLGMASMRFGGFFEWDAAIVALSVLIAMAAATAALWLAYSTHRRSHRIAASLVMATAVCTMHYTGMAAATVVCTDRNAGAALADLLRPSELPGIVTVFALGIATMIALDALLQRMNQRASANRPAG